MAADEEKEFKVVPLHHSPYLYDTCADLLNSEWMRSKTARLHSLRKSCDQLPISLVMVAHRHHPHHHTHHHTDPDSGEVTHHHHHHPHQPHQPHHHRHCHLEPDSGGQPYVIGHSMLSRVVGMEGSCFVESVLVDKEHRGRGLGRKMMIASEEHAVRLGFHTIYLSTHDKQGFYEHLGYRYCDPVSKADSCTKLLPEGFLKQLCNTAASSAGNANASALPPNGRRTSAEKKKKVECATVSSHAERMTPAKMASTIADTTTTTTIPTSITTTATDSTTDTTTTATDSTTDTTTTTTDNSNNNNKNYNNNNNKSSNANSATTVTDKHMIGQSPSPPPPSSSSSPSPSAVTPTAQRPPPPPPPLAKSSNRPEIGRMDSSLISWMKKELC